VIKENAGAPKTKKKNISRDQPDGQHQPFSRWRAANFGSHVKKPEAVISKEEGEKKDRELLLEGATSKMKRGNSP